MCDDIPDLVIYTNDTPILLGIQTDWKELYI